MLDLGRMLVRRAANPHLSAAIQISWKDCIISFKVHDLIWRLNSACSQCCTCLVTQHLVCIESQAVCRNHAVALCNGCLK